MPRFPAIVAAAALAVSLNAFAGNGPVPGTTPALGINALPDEVAAELLFMREEEKLARDTYLVLSEEWELVIFENIAASEQHHMDAVGNLIGIYQLTDPVADESVTGGFVNPELALLFEDLKAQGLNSVTDGLTVGAIIEETDILDLQEAIGLAAGYDNITAVFENLLCGSRNHLRAFVGQLDLLGVEYEPFILTDEEFSAIVDSPFERGCGQTNTEQRRSGRP